MRTAFLGDSLRDQDPRHVETIDPLWNLFDSRSMTTGAIGIPTSVTTDLRSFPGEVIGLHRVRARPPATKVCAFTEERGPEMWAQLITTRLKPGREGDLPKLLDQLRAIEQPGAGLLRSTAMQDQNDPSRVFMIVVFESEEKARGREQDPRRQEGLQGARATMAEIFEGPPEFVDLTVLDEFVP